MAPVTTEGEPEVSPEESRAVLIVRDTRGLLTNQVVHLVIFLCLFLCLLGNLHWWECEGRACRVRVPTAFRGWSVVCWMNRITGKLWAWHQSHSELLIQREALGFSWGLAIEERFAQARTSEGHHVV